MRKLIALLVGAGLASLAFSASALAAPIVVNSDSDLSALGAPCTLREALQSANANGAAGNGCADGSGTDAISFDPAVFVPGGPANTIDLNAGMGVHLDLNSNLTVTGPGASDLIIDGATGTRTIVASGAANTATVSGLTVTGGSLNGTGNSQGAGIYNEGALTLNQVTVSGNQLLRTANAGSDVQAVGGGIFNTASGILTLNQSTVKDNTASAVNGQADSFGSDARGGGIFSFGAIQIHNSVIDDNHAIAQDSAGAAGAAFALGGGIGNSGVAVDIDHSQITRNDASASAGSAGIAANAEGAGISTNSGGPNTIEETTIAGNALATTVAGGTATRRGGAIYNTGATLNLISDTIASNGPSPAGIAANIANTGGQTHLKNTIVSDPLGAGATNCTSPVTTTDGFNLDFSPAGLSCIGAGELFTNPLLDPAGLAANGGPTETIALMPGSPAIDTGSNAGQAALFLTQDQRGLLRPVDFAGVSNAGGNGTDRGAFEVQKACAVQSTPGGACPQPSVTQPVVNPPAQPGATGQQAAALKKCKKKKSKTARSKCKKRAKLLPL
jgi:hypothetical protein